MKPGSLRGRIFTGATIWAIGLLAVTTATTTLAAHLHVELTGFIHSGALLVTSIIFLVAGLAVLERMLSPFDRLRTRLQAVREGRAPRIDGHYPGEVQPLVDDLNGLLADREQRVARAISKAGDLAHGLKTPLAVINQEAERARSAGQPELASAITQQVERMRRQVDYHLAQARAAASGVTTNARSLLTESAEGLARTLQRLHADRGLEIVVDVPLDCGLRAQREDLDEMLGNLLDNACKWARSTVRVSASTSDGNIVIVVDDDGPGLDPSMWERVLQRGVRADEASPGSGLGLAIVRDLVELYGGSITLGRSALGGLQAQLRLPPAPEA